MLRWYGIDMNPSTTKKHTKKKRKGRVKETPPRKNRARNHNQRNPTEKSQR
jgi:hypothetical protein